MILKQKTALSLIVVTCLPLLLSASLYAQKAPPVVPLATAPAASAAPATKSAPPSTSEYDPTKQSDVKPDVKPAAKAGQLAQPTQPTQLTQPEASANSVPRTLLWEVKSQKGNSVYLFGTIHVGKASFYPLPETVDNAFKRSAVLVVEANILDQKDGAEIARLIDLPKGKDGKPQTVDKLIKPALLARLKTQLAANKIPYANVANMQPVMLGGMLPIIEFVKLGYEMNQGLDFKLIERAMAEKKPIKELETALGQIKLLTGMSLIMQEAFLDNAVTSLETGKGGKQVVAIVEAWQKGDPKLLAKLADEASRDGVMTEALNEHLLAGRHPAMLEKIEGYLASNDVHFVAVGSLHLVGRGGLVEMLKALGYSVAQL